MVMPRLKKSSLDPVVIQNYRPISNLSFMSSRSSLTTWQLATNLFPEYQSGFHRHHSTETAILRVLSDIFSTIDQDQVSLLDVSSAFDTVDHSTLLKHLSTSYGLSGMAFIWLESYITGRVQVIHVGGCPSTPAMVYFGDPHGSVLYYYYYEGLLALYKSPRARYMSSTQPISSN